MRLDHLRYLLEIDKRRSISAAAQTLYLGQTTLSAIVKNVEQELGFAIFRRTHSGVQVTPEGEAALALVREIDASYDEIKRLSGQASPTHPVPVVLSPTVNSALALRLNQHFLAKEPQGNLYFQVVSGDEVGAKIIRNEGNIGITHFTADNLKDYRLIAGKYQIRTDVLLPDQICLVVRQDHPLAGRGSVTPEELTGYHFAILSHFSICEDSIAYIKSFGQENCYTVFPYISLIKQAVLQQNMVAILTDFASEHGSGESGAGLCRLRLQSARPAEEIFICLIHRQESNIRPLEREVVSCIKECFQQLSE